MAESDTEQTGCLHDVMGKETVLHSICSRVRKAQMRASENLNRILSRYILYVVELMTGSGVDHMRDYLEVEAKTCANPEMDTGSSGAGGYGEPSNSQERASGMWWPGP
jgi:hypothetical protein